MSAVGWLRWVGSPKLHVSFAEYSLFYRALLQKRPIILRCLLIVATPYMLKTLEQGTSFGIPTISIHWDTHYQYVLGCPLWVFHQNSTPDTFIDVAYTHTSVCVRSHLTWHVPLDVSRTYIIHTFDTFIDVAYTHTSVCVHSHLTWHVPLDVSSTCISYIHLLMCHTYIHQYVYTLT